MATATPPNALPPLLTPKQACEYLGISHTTLRRYVLQGRLPAIKLGHRTVRYRAEDIQRLVDGETS